MTPRYLHLVLVASTLASSVACAQVTVTGTVIDSVGHRRLAGAIVQLEAESSRQVKTTTADSLGLYRIDDLAPDTYIIAFLHPALDSLGIDLAPKLFSVAGPGEQRVNLVIPPPERIAATLCRKSAPNDSTGLLLGHLRDAETGLPRQGTVTVMWMELTIGQGGIKRVRQQIPIKSNELGWFAFCGLPSDVGLEASAQAGDEESGIVELHVPAGSLLLRDFLVSRADSAIAPLDDSIAKKGGLPSPMLRRGSARVAGVVHSDKGMPIGNADVSVPGTGLDGRTQASGSFSLGGLPSGTQTVEVRAIGFEPKRVIVDLSSKRLTTLDLVLEKPVQTLDPVKVYGSGNTTAGGFQRRLKNGFGYILTPADVQKRSAVRVSDFLRTMPGVRVVPTRGFGYAVLLRDRCVPTLYMNGNRMYDNAAADIDDLATPGDVTAVEVYQNPGQPAEFPGNGCGSVVIWAGMLPR